MLTDKIATFSLHYLRNTAQCFPIIHIQAHAHKIGTLNISMTCL